MRTLYLLVILICMFAIESKSQGPNLFVTNKAIVSGFVIDKKSNKAVEYASLTLRRKADSSLVAGTVSDSTGKFHITNISKGEYYLAVNFLGYKKMIIPDINVNSVKREYNLGKIEIESNDNMLSNVNIISQRNNVEYKLDKKVINVAQNLNSTGGTAVDILQNTPSVRVDNNGNVSLRGNTNFIVLINGKQSPLEGSDALRQISANSVEKMEIVTNPTAKYDAEGGAGIINVILKKRTSAGLNGIINSSIGTGEKYSSDFMLNYKLNRVNFYFGVDYRKNKNTSNFKFNRNYTLENLNYFDDSYADMYQKRQPLNIKFGTDVEINKNNNLSINVNSGNSASERGLSFENAWGLALSNSTEYSTSSDSYISSVNFINPVFDYNHYFNLPDHKISFEVGYIYQDGGLDQTRGEDLCTADYETISSLMNLKGRNDQTRYNWRIKTDYSYKINQNSNLETGILATFGNKNVDVRFNNFNSNNNQWEVDTALTYSFCFQNNIYAGYSTFTTKLIGFDFEVGLRAEQTDRRLFQTPSGFDYKYNKLDFFPTFHLSKKLESGDEFQLSYSRRITRPLDAWLNPYASHADSRTVSRGNPELKPQYIDSYELNFIKDFKNIQFSIETYYRKSIDLMVQGFYLDEKGTQVVKFCNLRNDKSLGAEISANIDVLKKLQINPVVNLYNYWINGTVLDYDFSSKTFTYEGRLNINYLPISTMKFQVNASYNSAYITQQGTMGHTYKVNISTKRDFFNKKLSVTLQCQDILKSAGDTSDEKAVNLTSRTIYQPEGRIFLLNISYIINNFKKTTRNFNLVDAGA